MIHDLRAHHTPLTNASTPTPLTGIPEQTGTDSRVSNITQVWGQNCIYEAFLRLPFDVY